MKQKSLLSAVGVVTALACLTAACNDHRIPQPGFPGVVDAVNPGTFLPAVLAETNGVKIYNGGFGSAIVVDPKDNSVFYMLTDRGPNIDGTPINQVCCLAIYVVRWQTRFHFGVAFRSLHKLSYDKNLPLLSLRAPYAGWLPGKENRRT